MRGSSIIFYINLITFDFLRENRNDDQLEKNYISLLCTKTRRLESECKNLNMLRVNDHHTVHNSIINICVRSDQITQRSLMLYLNQDTRSPSSFYAHNNHDSPDL